MYRDEIRRRMAERGWNQLDLSIASGVNPATLSRFFGQKYDLDIAQLTAIATAFHAKPGDLLERSSTDERVVQLQPILDEIASVANAERWLLVAALASQARFMKSWRTPEVGREIRQSGTPPTKPGDETIEPSSSR